MKVTENSLNNLYDKVSDFTIDFEKELNTVEVKLKNIKKTLLFGKIHKLKGGLFHSAI